MTLREMMKEQINKNTMDLKDNLDFFNNWTPTTERDKLFKLLADKYEIKKFNSILNNISNFKRYKRLIKQTKCEHSRYYYFEVYKEYFLMLYKANKYDGKISPQQIILRKY